MNLRVYTDLIRLFLDLADKAVDAEDAELAHRHIDQARAQLDHTVRELERKGARGA